MKKMIGENASIARITECLYLSSYNSITEERLRERKITHIINITEELDNVVFNSLPDLKCVKIPILDSEKANIFEKLSTCVELITEANIRGGRTLVHCVMGISRSATVCMAYMMQEHKMTLRQAYNHVKSCRNCIHPNTGFWEQVIRYEDKLHGKTTVEMRPTALGFLPEVYQEENNLVARWTLRQSDVNNMLTFLFLIFSSDILWLIYQHFFGRN